MDSDETMYNVAGDDVLNYDADGIGIVVATIRGPSVVHDGVESILFYSLIYDGERLHPYWMTARRVPPDARDDYPDSDLTFEAID